MAVVFAEGLRRTEEDCLLQGRFNHKPWNKRRKRIAGKKRVAGSIRGGKRHSYQNDPWGMDAFEERSWHDSIQGRCEAGAVSAVGSLDIWHNVDLIEREVTLDSALHNLEEDEHLAASKSDYQR
jgi:hypothetical protein